MQVRPTGTKTGKSPTLGRDPNVIALEVAW
jgi:hypothetical protein